MIFISDAPYASTLFMIAFHRLLIVDSLPINWLSEMLVFLKGYEQITGYICLFL
jgi:hypothetical protein